jgi:hypothetical protein
MSEYKYLKSVYKIIFMIICNATQHLQELHVHIQWFL